MRAAGWVTLGRMVGTRLRLDALTRPRSARSRRGRAVVAVALVACLATAGCTEKDEAAGAPGAQSTAPGLTVSGEWPLTGFPATGTAPRHPVLAVKIDNSENSRPQVGLGQADLVTEELVEGGSTRLAVFYYQRVPRLVGPVRSMRATDIGIVQPAKAVLVATVERRRRSRASRPRGSPPSPRGRGATAATPAGWRRTTCS